MSDDDIKRKDLDRAVRHLNMSDADMRDLLLQLAARVVALTEELDRRGDGTLEKAVDALVPEALAQIRKADVAQVFRVELADPDDKYAATPATPPCDELMPICQARCCKIFMFALSTQDLDEGVIRFDYGRPYRIRKRAADGYCTHNDTTTHACTAHSHRPRVCRTYDCRNDNRIWADFDKRVLAPEGVRNEYEIDLVARVKARSAAVYVEDIAVKNGRSD